MLLVERLPGKDAESSNWPANIPDFQIARLALRAVQIALGMDPPVYIRATFAASAALLGQLPQNPCTAFRVSARFFRYLVPLPSPRPHEQKTR